MQHFNISMYYYRGKVSEILSTTGLGLEQDLELEKVENKIAEIILNTVIKSKKDLNKKEGYYLEVNGVYLESKNSLKDVEVVEFKIIPNFKELKKSFDKTLDKEKKV